FTFGEVYDEEERIAGFIGRRADQAGDIVGVDAALDFPLFFRLPSVAKGFTPPGVLSDMYEHRKQVERTVISSHGEASRYFVTFLDNHDQHQRLRYEDPTDPTRYDGQAILALGCLVSLQGIPCVYYGTEQGLHGSGDQDLCVREALWGKPGAFDLTRPYPAAVAALLALRGREPALRYGRQYFRPISGDGVHFGPSRLAAGVVAFSRILSGTELLVVANTNPAAGWAGQVIVDGSLADPGRPPMLLWGNAAAPAAAAAPVDRAGADLVVAEVDGQVGHGPLRTVGMTLGPAEIQVLRTSP
ncbi:MAG TPA: alpha-amylase family glycosyl hydrolase, partial [Solirubrobacteraceae bacterium]|nr:alpha-amylase family glycosyl hydrolase [Solirubrobacteraceae bacterium]